MQRLLINASNLHVGGGVQVATSVISELASLDRLPANVSVWASSEVDMNLKKLGCCVANLPSYEVVDVHGLAQLFSPVRHRLNEFDAIFTIFGPLYQWRLRAASIVGFAQSWIVYPDNEIYDTMSGFERLKTRLKFWLQSLFFRQADQLVVELDHVKEGLLKAGIGRSGFVRVVHNCLSTLYNRSDSWQPVNVPEGKAAFKIGFVGRNYAHKNTKIFPGVRELLKRKFDLDVCFYVTFTEEEWSACSPEFRSAVINVGPLSVAQCPSFYRAMDGVVFPSLLECFSATPLEAMAMERPLFASDRPFNRDVCGKHAHYFDPMNLDSAADVIGAYLLNGSGDRTALEDARIHALSFANAADRARQYLECLLEVAGCKKSLT